MTPNTLLGRRVIATNERGGKWRGRVERCTLWGEVEVVCEAIDIGYGWHELRPVERKAFPIEQVEVSDATDDNDIP